MLLDPNCPCGSQKPHELCCEPYLTGQSLPPTAEALMRSRYAAYCQGQVDYLVDTLHPSKRRSGDQRSLEQSIRTTRWTSLTIVATKQGQERHQRGIVEFAATYDRPTAGQMHERSRFMKEGDRWFYLDGDMLPPLSERATAT